MRWLSTLFLYVLSAVVAWAGQVSFQSGEHDGFTRLVMTLPDATTEWALSGTGETYLVTVADPALKVDAGSVFGRIRRDRLKEIVADEAKGQIRLVLNCRCQIKTRILKDRYVVFDIRDRVAKTNIRPDRFVFELDPIEMEVTRRFRFAETGGGMPTYPSKVEAKERISDIVEAATAPESAVDKQKALATAQSELFEQIGRAATQSLLEPVQVLPQRASQKPESASFLQETTERNPDRTGGKGNMAAHNAMDEFLTLQEGLSRALVPGSRCLPEDALDIGAWADDRTIDAQVAALRGKLYGEFDAINLSAAQELARLYVHFTFGVEARQILNMAAVDDALVLLEMSYLVEGLPPQTKVFQEQAECAGPSALWALLSGARLSEEHVVTSVVNTFNNMPRHLREHLGGRLSAALNRQGHIEAAELVLNAVERLNGPKPPDFGVAQAKLASAKGDHDTANEKLREVVDNNSEMSLDAIVDLIDLHVRQDLAPTSDTIALVGAFAVEHKHTPYGPKLRRAHYLARLQAREHGSALDLLEEIEKLDDANTVSDLRDMLGRSLVAHADDFEFLELSVGRGLVAPGMFSEPVAVLVAERLVDRGFLREARQQLQAALPGMKSDRRRLIMARIALDEGLPRRAEAEILGLSGRDADELRAAARAAAGDHSKAAALLQAIGDIPAATEQAWLGGDWQALAETESYQKLALLNGEPIEPVVSHDGVEPLTNGILSRNRALLDESVDVRSVIGELLEMHPASQAEGS
ncbi:hypothetical protein SAMN04488042_1011386 [Shimia aestuarii]|uniref:Tetratricopeptide repeat-containing protein n=2 Tax=Shimia aestuarii TaxID=254406 RepID=A0A1I4K9W3_9RHOB|nr:hypothetical protein SAMN04488042_1011386 [Shimia aestuarii]